jgi:DNA-binding NarL/FixJ family response regulator
MRTEPSRRGKPWPLRFLSSKIILPLAVCGEAASGEEALRLIPHLHPDLVLVDLSLPQMNGLTFIAHLYQTQPTLPVLIVSSHEPKAFTPLYNVKEYIHKDTAPQRLVPTIQQVLAT